MNPTLQCKPAILPLFIAGVLACFGLLPIAQAVVSPPDGGYPNFTTAEGTKALQSLTTGSANTAVGWFSLSTKQRAASTPLPARGRSFLIPQAKIRPLAQRRFYSTPPASTTPPLERPLFQTIPPPKATRLMERLLFLATPKA